MSQELAAAEEAITMKFARMRDKNEPDIIAALRAAGAIVSKLNEAGAPDLLVGYRGETYLLEVKRPLGPRGGKHDHGQPGGGGEMTDHQVKWWERWRGRPPVLVRSAQEALVAIGVVRLTDASPA